MRWCLLGLDREQSYIYIYIQIYMYIYVYVHTYIYTHTTPPRRPYERALSRPVEKSGGQISILKSSEDARDLQDDSFTKCASKMSRNSQILGSAIFFT